MYVNSTRHDIKNKYLVFRNGLFLKHLNMRVLCMKRVICELNWTINFRLKHS